MATSRDAPNPLRPYYVPPSIGLTPDLSNNQTQTSSLPSFSSRSPKPSLGTQARDILSDLDYDSYFPDASPSVTDHAKKLLDQALWNYTSVLLAQPFEVAKTILQIREAQGQLGGFKAGADSWGKRSRPESFASGKFEDVRTHLLLNCYERRNLRQHLVPLRRRIRRGLTRLLYFRCPPKKPISPILRPFITLTLLSDQKTKAAQESITLANSHPPSTTRTYQTRPQESRLPS